MAKKKTTPKYFRHPRTGNIIKIIGQIDLVHYECQIIAENRIYVAPRKGEDLIRHHDILGPRIFRKLRRDRKQLSLF